MHLSGASWERGGISLVPDPDWSSLWGSGSSRQEVQGPDGVPPGSTLDSRYLYFSFVFGGYCWVWDVEDVKFVINYDYPNSSEDYIHRIGRTARSTNKGTAYTFFTPGNLRQARELIRVLEEARQAINPKLLQLVDSGRGGGGGGGGGRSRFRGSGSNSNNPNLMYQDECDRRMRTVGGGNRDTRGGSSGATGGGSSTSTSSSFSRDGRGGGGSRDGDRSSSSSSSSYRDRGSRDSRSGGSYSNGSTSSSSFGVWETSIRATAGGRGWEQWGPVQLQGRVSVWGHHFRRGQWGQDQSGQQQGQFGNLSGRSSQPPPPSGPQPLMAQQFSPPQPMMGFMGQGPYQFAPPPPPPPPPPRK
ncbi:hypothetical protein ANANG_G00291400 [Anguilla anguilla]|uniref:Helicase C-terminal domain-containing protein n=1 Tax=Anguilla anguilla TaxID=7936 RepID=A0A9D3LK39_ANGAN|nr:hypothetical protein ANANG_G00291400 [Anguilla anguilla]